MLNLRIAEINVFCNLIGKYAEKKVSISLNRFNVVYLAMIKNEITILNKKN